MSIEYTLYLDTTASPKELLLELHRCMSNPTEHRDGTGGPASVSSSGVSATPRTPDETTRKFIDEDFDIQATEQITFDIDKFNLGLAQDALLQCISNILACVNGDAALLYNGETIVLRRSSGAITLREGFGPWTRDRLAHFALPYHLGPLPPLSG